MQTSHKPLLKLTAADLMSEALVLIPKSMSLAGAARLLSQAHVTGAPVVDDEGRCIGVLSSTDFMHYMEEARPRHRPTAPHSGFCASWQINEPRPLPEEEVWQFMTKDPVTVTRSSQIGGIARAMLDAHIHRVIVVNDNLAPIGIISTTDILAAVARAEQEQEHVCGGYMALADEDESA